MGTVLGGAGGGGRGGRNCPFDCGAVTLSAFFFPFGVLERKMLGNCVESWSLPSFLFIRQTPG